jgi:glycosyltransferase involved in cell wall biosynthesis
MSKQIVITGMHRSGTSLVASLLQKAGVNIGEQLQGASKGNLRGHFEDSDFYNFHQGVLKRRGQSFLVQSLDSMPGIAPNEFIEARSLIERRRHKAIWGWKDPRTSLFLDFWHSLLSDPCYLFLYRHPIETALSLLRRGTDLEVLINPWVAIRTWQVYNQNILNFYRAHPQICLLCHVSGITNDIDASIELFARSFGLPLHAEGLQSLYHPDELKQGLISPEVDAILQRIASKAMELYRQLEIHADLPGSEKEGLSESQTSQISVLKQITYKLTDEGQSSEYLLPLLLQILDPEAISTASSIFKEAAYVFQTQMAEKEQAIHTLTIQVAEKEQAIRTLLIQTNYLTRELNAIHTATWWKLATSYWSMLWRLRTMARQVLPLKIRHWLHVHPRQTNAASPSPATKAEVHIPPGQGVDIICFSLIDWNFRFQRPQQLLIQFARDGHRVFYLRTGFTGLERQSVDVYSPSERVYELALPGNPDTIIYKDLLTSSTLDQALSALQEFIDQHQVTEAVCLVQFPFWEPLAQALKARYGWKIVYDCMDDHSGFELNNPAVVKRETELVANSDLVVVTSQLLYQRMAQIHPNCILVPNAGDYAHFSQLPPRDASPLANMQRPVIGYYGAIAEWFDVEAMRHAAASHPEWSFVLIGHTFGANLKDLKRRANVHLLPEQPYIELPLYLAGFNVCTIPFLRTPLTEATNPVKVFEYLSAGKPVVASALPELEPLANVVYQYTSPDEFASLLELALSEDSPTLAARRRMVARQNTWDMRYQALKLQIEALYEKVSLGCHPHTATEYQYEEGH